MRVVTWNLWWRFGPWQERQKAILEFSAGVLRLAQGVGTRTGHVALHRACRAVEHATPVFAGDVSAGAPGLAGAWIGLAELFPETAETEVAGTEHAADGASTVPA